MEEEEGAHNGILKRFKKVESLGDTVLFLGYNSPIVVMASQFPALKEEITYILQAMFWKDITVVHMDALIWEFSISKLGRLKNFVLIDFIVRCHLLHGLQCLLIPFRVILERIIPNYVST